AWVRGRESPKLIAPSQHGLVVAALGESRPPPPAGIEGGAATFAPPTELEAAPAGSLSGKIAFVSARMVRMQDGSGYAPAVAARIDGPAAAARAGASAFLMRSAGTDSHRLAHTGTTTYVNGRVALPAFALS